MSTQFVYFTGEELRKLFHRGKLKVLMLLSFLIGTVFVFAGSRIGLTGDLSVIALELLLVTVVPLLMASLGSDLMVTEFRDGTMKNALKLPLSRETIFLGKMLAGWIAGALLIVSMYVPASIGSLILTGVPEWSVVGASIAEVIGAIVFCGLLVVLANTVALWMGSSGIGLVVSVVLWMAMGVIGVLEPQLNRFFVTDFADWMQPLLYEGQVSASITALLFMIGYYMIGTIFGLWAFQRKEV